MPQYIIPTAIIVEAVDPIQAQAYAYGLLTDVITAEVEFAEQDVCGCETCDCGEDPQPKPIDFWTYDYDDVAHPVELLDVLAEAK